MRRWMLATLLAFMVVIWPAGGAGADGERVVFEATVVTSQYRPSSMCMEIEPGVLTSTVQSVGDPNARLGFFLGPDGNGDFPGERVNTAIPTAAVTYQTTVRQPMTCFALQDDSDPRAAGPSVHKVAVRLVWSP